MGADMIEKLRMLHQQGLSGTQIARQIPGATRNAVIGKLHRLGLTNDDRPAPRLTPKGGGRKPTAALTIMGTTRVSVAALTKSKPPTPYVEPTMPVLEGDAPPLHSRAHHDLEDGMCYWPLYIEQGVQMYCACKTERLPGRFDAYCPAHKGKSEMAPAQRRGKYRGVWGS